VSHARRSPSAHLAPFAGILFAGILAGCATTPPGSRVAEPPAGTAPAAPPSGKKLLTLDHATGRERVRFSGSPPDYRWDEDGEHLVHRSDGKRWRVDPRTLERAEIEKEEPAGRKEALEAAFRALEGFDEKRAAAAAGSRPRGDDEGPLLLTFEEDLWAFHPDEGRVVRLTDDDDSEHEEELSPDGETVAFVKKNDLFFVDAGGGEPRRATEGGGDELLHGRLDWVYQEEIYGRGNFKGFWWSPDSDGIAFLRLDESPVNEFTVVDHIPVRLEVEVTNYPKAGDPNPIASLGYLARDGGDPVWIDLSAYDGEEILIVRVGWSPEGDRIVFQVQDRIQTWLDLLAADPATGETTRLFRETSDAWVDVEGPPRWLDDGTFLWLSERTGFRHLYHYEADGTLVRPLTAGEWEVRRIVEIDEARGEVWFTASMDGAVNDHAYRVGFDGSPPVRVTHDDGSHRISLNADRTLFLDTWSSLQTPPARRLCDRDGKILHELGEAEIPALDEYAYTKRELFEIPARDGYLMDATLLKPPSFDPETSYPVWLDTYSGPDAPRVRNSWNGDSWHQFLAQQGYLVFQVNNRTSSRKGQRYVAQCYKQFGVKELEDLEDAVRWLTGHPWADASRVGIYGWSYGGFMAAYALTRSDLFALGIAGAGVYDWRDYDTIYTERYMSTPQKNPEGYDKSSVRAKAADLRGHLLILHGTMDDNVHVQNALQLAYELQKAGKSFDLMLYPKSRHGVRHPAQRAHMRELMWNTMREHL